MLRFFTSDLRRNLIKIICLTVGLSVGFLLVAKVYFEQTYDSFLPKIDRIYRLTESVSESGNYKEYPFTPGGTANEFKRQIPQIELATRITEFTGNTVIKLDDGRMFEINNIILADTCFFDVISTPILAGNPHEIFELEDHVMIPRSLAEKIGDNVIGLRISNVGFGDDYKMTISGIYEDFPLNSTIGNAVYLGLPTIVKFDKDDRDNLLGYERYHSYVLLHEDVKPEDMHQKAMEILREKLPSEVFDHSNYNVWFRPLLGSYASQEGVKTRSWLLGLLAVVMLMCAGLNYLLIVMGQTNARSKEMAIRKCYGTSFGQLFGRVMGESLFFLVVSLGLALLLAFSFSNLFRELLGYTPQQLFSTKRVWIVEGVVCLGLLIITGVIPAIIYSKTPVAHAFRPSNKSRKSWKLVLLSVQFFASGLLLCILVLVWRQHRMIVNLKMGFEYENIGLFMRNGLSSERTASIIEELRKLPCVEKVATTNRDIASVASVNNMWLEGQMDKSINIADMQMANPELIDVMGIRILQGRNFRTDADSTTNEVLVEERFIGELQKMFDIEGDNIIGQTFYITGHGNKENPYPEMTIVGVIENMRRGGYESEQADFHAGVLFPTSWMNYWVYVRFSELTPENLKAAQNVIDSLKDGNEIYIWPYRKNIDLLRQPIVRFGTSVVVVGIAILIIALIGLIGYVADEVNRRAKEIAIRKVNGATAQQIIKIFCIDILKIALPSLILGGVAAMILGKWWLSQFTDRVGLSPLSMALCLAILILVITGVVIINSFRVAHSNPVDYLRSE